MILLILLRSGIFSTAQSQFAHQHFDHYNFENGLSSNRVQCMAQDSDGFLWIGTASGLNRFDGNSFVHYYKEKDNKSLADNNVNDIVCLPHHTLAIATANGLSFLDTHADTFFTYQYSDTSKLSVQHNYFKSLCLDDHGNLWAGTGCDIFIFSTKLKLIHSNSSGYTAADVGSKVIAWISKISKLPNKQMLVESDFDFDIYDIDDYTCQHTGSPRFPAWSFLPAAYPNTYAIDSAGQMWFERGPADSLFCFDWNKHTLRSYPLFKDASSHYFPFGAICNFSSQLAYIYLADAGLYLLQKENNNNEISLVKDIPTNLESVNFFRDHENNLWIGCTEGLYESSPEKNRFQSFLFPEDNKKVKTADNEFISKIGNDLWVASYGNGFYRFNLQTQKIDHYLLSFHATDLLPYTWNIHQYNGDTLLIGTLQGLIWFDTSNTSFGRLPFSHPAVLDTFPITTQFTDHTGLIWMGIGAGHGVIAFDPPKKIFHVYDHTQFPLRHPTAIAEDEQGNLWMATQKGGGLVEWARKNNQFTIMHASGSNSFIDEGINCLCADQHGQLWIGTSSSGLACYDLKKKTFTTFGKENGLSYDQVDEVNPAQYPYLWIITAFGLNRFNAITKTFESFYTKDGLPADELSSGNYFDASAGNMYLGWQDGLIRFDAAHFSTNKNPPNIFIDKLQVNNEPVYRDPNQFLSFNYNQNNLTVFFTAVDLISGSDLKFRYRINDGKNWIDLGNNRQINFSNLSPGKYQLLIAATNKSGVWNENATVLHFFIASPFWKTWWFYSLVVLCISAAVYLLYRFRMKQIQRMQEMRNRIAQDLHDDIGGTVTAMNLTNELAIQRLNDPNAAKKLMMSMGDDLHNVGETLDDIVWMVNPKNDSMEQVFARMRRYASGMWETAGIDFSISFETISEKVRLNMEQRHDLYLVFKEAVNNVVKHSKCHQASATLSLSDHSIIVKVSDDGIGFDSSLSTHRNGLRNMQNRMKKWKGDFSVLSEENKGTTFSFRLPITQKED
ncbi:MAG: two-component regulator propeller domain-containing protein [Chitinophagales bacterium]